MAKELKVVKVKDRYIYVCYPICAAKADRGLIVLDVSDCKRFIDIKKAERFMKENYAQYVLGVEACEEQVYQEVRREYER